MRVVVLERKRGREREGDKEGEARGGGGMKRWREIEGEREE